MLNITMPNRTILQCGLAALASVLLMSWLRIRPIGVLLLTFLGFWIYWTRCNFRIVPPPELQQKFTQLTERVTDYRRNRPTMFCAVASGCLGILAILGHFLSSSTVVFAALVFAAVISTKYNFKVVKIELKDFAWSDRLNHNNENEFDDEFMPDVNDESNLFVLERASDLATISSPTDADDDEEKSDEIPSELLIPDSIPEIDEHSSDDDDDLVPITRKSTTNAAYNIPPTTIGGEGVAAAAAGQATQQSSQSQTAAQGSTSSTSSKDVMEFRKGHFKRDSSLSSTSSSSQESLSKGLQFPDHTAIDGPSLRQLMDGGEGINISSAVSEPHNQEAANIVAMAVKSQTQALLAQGTKLLPSLVSGLVQWGSNGGTVATTTPLQAPATAPVQRRMVTALDSSDDSDFEILETDDFE